MVGKSRPHRDLDRWKQLAGPRGQRSESEDPVVLANQRLELALRFAGRAGSKDRRDGEFRQSVGDALLSGFDLIQSDARQLGFDKQTERHLAPCGAALLSAEIVP